MGTAQTANGDKWFELLMKKKENSECWNMWYFLKEKNGLVYGNKGKKGVI